MDTLRIKPVAFVLTAALLLGKPVLADGARPLHTETCTTLASVTLSTKELKWSATNYSCLITGFYVEEYAGGAIYAGTVPANGYGPYTYDLSSLGMTRFVTLSEVLPDGTRAKLVTLPVLYPKIWMPIVRR